MQDDAPTPEVARFLRQAAAAFPAVAPAPGAELGLLLAAGLPVAAPTTPPRRLTMFRAKICTLPAKLALAAAGMTFATTGLAAANALPAPVQEIAADLGDAVGVDVPDDTTTPPTDGTTPLPTDGTTPLPTDGTTPPPAAEVLPPPATTAQQAAHIHAFDEACGNHGRYVSYVAKNGAEPPCATGLRGGSAPTTEPPAAGPTTEPTAGAAATARPGKAAKASKPAKAPKAAKTAKAPKAGKAAKAKG